MQVREQMTAAESTLAQRAAAELSLKAADGVIVNFEGTEASPKGGAWFIFRREGGRPPLRAFLTHFALKQGIAASMSGWGPEFWSKLEPLLASKKA